MGASARMVERAGLKETPFPIEAIKQTMTEQDRKVVVDFLRWLDGTKHKLQELLK
jgi:hypothetical protein